MLSKSPQNSLLPSAINIWPQFGFWDWALRRWAGHESQNSTFKHRGVRDPELTRQECCPTQETWRMEGTRGLSNPHKDTEKQWREKSRGKQAGQENSSSYLLYIHSIHSINGIYELKGAWRALVYLQRRKDLPKVTHGQLVGQSRLDIGPANANSNVKNIWQLCRADGVSSDQNLPSLALASPLSNAPPCSTHSRHHALSQAQDIHLPTCHSLILIFNHPSTNHSKEAISANLSPSSQRRTKCFCFWASAPPITTWELFKPYCTTAGIPQHTVGTS